MENFVIDGNVLIKVLNKESKVVKIPDGIKMIANNTFSNYEKLEKVILPDTIERIGDWEFDLTTPLGAFENCISLKEINLPNGLKYMESGCFRGCTSLESMTIPDSVEYMESGCFKGCTSLKEIKLSKNKNFDIIRNYTFEGCTSLESIIIPDNIEEIGHFSFQNCTSLEVIKMKKVRYISNNSFRGCTSLKEMTFPSTLTHIGSYAFAYCNKLERIHGALIKEIILQNNTFEGCTSLKEINGNIIKKDAADSYLLRRGIIL